MADRNYGGMTSGFRWVFWLAPLWLVVMLPAADVMAARRWTARRWRWLLLAFGPFGQLSDVESLDHPWLMDYFKYMGWIL